jgi:hypothetical protein
LTCGLGKQTASAEITLGYRQRIAADAGALLAENTLK